MHELFMRAVTAITLVALCVSIYFYASSHTISAFLILLLCYILLFEYRPLYKPYAITSYIALILIIGGFITLIYFNEYHHKQFVLPFILAALADTGGYIIGKLIGKHYIAPSISPKKTWEGFIGSCIFTIVGTTIALYYYVAPQSMLTKELLQTYIFVGFSCALAGLLGDLCISQLKRNADVKDTGTLLPGHGGLLDRFDSILAIAIILFFL